ncbi:MAG: DUF4062 domain-containing protein [Candidatus Acidiferrales bacterium]
MEKRYQVFVSSTYADLKEERRKVIQAVIEMDCIPAGMELFPAADEEQFQFIKRVIDDCDYYLLIVGGRYGSTTAEGISYTEKEYDYAVSRGLKVIALVHQNPDEIPLGKSEKDPLLRERLEAFKKKVSTGRLVKAWNSADELPALVTVSLAHTMKMFPAIGWIRANRAASEDLLAEINDLRKKNAQLQGMVGNLQPTIENLAGLEDKIRLYGTYRPSSFTGGKGWNATFTWGEIFGLVSPYLVRLPTDTYVKSVLGTAAFTRSDRSGWGDSPVLDDQIFRTVAVQLKALGLVHLEYSQTTAGGMDLFWLITPSGERTMMELRTVKKAAGLLKQILRDEEAK